MAGSIPQAHDLLSGLVNRPISTVTGRRNVILDVGDSEVLVATDRSPGGSWVPIEWVRAALDRLAADGEVEISVESVGHRSAFVGAVLLELPETRAIRSTPPRVVLSDGGGELDRMREAGGINAWWQDGPGEHYWLEITDRDDPGVDLHAPQRDAAGNPTPGYSLMWWVMKGDLVFHYERRQQAITSWSRAVGAVVEAPTLWLSHKGSTRRRVGVPVEQPGWWLDLEGPFALDRPLTLAELRRRGSAVRSVLDGLREREAGSLYFPFFFYRDKELRPMQPYLNKLPAAFVIAMPELAGGMNTGEAAAPDADASGIEPAALGVEYRPAEPGSGSDERDPFTVDPAVIERGLRGHAETQNRLAEMLAGAGIEPRSPRPEEPNFDLAWQRDGDIYVAEVKSTTPSNEERQLRLGLGQVLRYRNLLAKNGSRVRAVLVAENPPRDPSWHRLCEELGVILVGPGNLRLLLQEQGGRGA